MKKGKNYLSGKLLENLFKIYKILPGQMKMSQIVHTLANKVFKFANIHQDCMIIRE
jgi:hypothetical protein